jgi:hypothetical protein
MAIALPFDERAEATSNREEHTFGTPQQAAKTKR